MKNAITLFIFLISFTTNAQVKLSKKDLYLDNTAKKYIKQNYFGEYTIKNTLRASFYNLSYRMDYDDFTNDSEVYQIYDSKYTYKKNGTPFMWSPNSETIYLHKPLLSFWAGKSEFIGDDTAPAKPNCSERNFRLKDLIKIINLNEVQSVEDVLVRIPEDSLQKFTFIHKSKSLQNDTDKMNPRVLRYNTDGSLSITYTINPEKNSYDTLEIMSFDENKRRYNFHHISFPHNKESDLFKRKQKVITKNHKSCLACHGGNDPRPNWTEYDNWPGVYGSNDDRIGARLGDKTIFDFSQLESYEKRKIRRSLSGSSYTFDKLSKESVDYENFRIKQKDNPLIRTLPWPSETSKGFKHYPYTTAIKKMNYNFRPNAHFTIVQSRRNAQRLARKFQETKDWNKIKYLVGMNALNCRNFSDLDKEMMTKIRRLAYETNRENYIVRDGEDRFLINLGRAYGFYGSDWTLHFNKGGPKEKNWKYRTAQWPMTDFVYSVIYRDIVNETPNLMGLDYRFNRMSNLFGNNFKCVDNIADKILLPKTYKKKACDILYKKQEELGLQNSDTLLSPNLPIHRNTREGQGSRESIWFTSKKHGKRLVKNLCADCHNGEVLKLNFKNEELLKKQIDHMSEGMYALVKQKLGSEEKCEMPYSSKGACLTKNERKSVLLYLRSLEHN